MLVYLLDVHELLSFTVSTGTVKRFLFCTAREFLSRFVHLRKMFPEREAAKNTSGFMKPRNNIYKTEMKPNLAAELTTSVNIEIFCVTLYNPYPMKLWKTCIKLINAIIQETSYHFVNSPAVDQSVAEYTSRWVRTQAS